ncbi:MAG: FxLYD domain-containing protein [Candidatus Nitrosocosmicus sp.]|nr:FxLYD domain-containing protein [Candidatus Nitrosocosmicus sp.]
MYKITMTTFSILFLLSLITYINHFLPANASEESDVIIQITSEPTDFPGNNQDTLEILFTKATKNSNDAVHVIGSIKNVGQDTLRSVDVTAHFFDENNKTVGVTTCCYAEPSDMEPGHTSSFDSFSTAEQIVDEPKYFRLSFDWDVSKVSMIDNILNSAIVAKSDPVKDAGSGLECGDITTNFTLNSDLYCDSDGLNVVNQNGLTIDLNGYTLSGPGIQSDNRGASLEEQNAGIRLEDSSNMIIKGPGTIKDFDAGVLNNRGDGNKISRVTFTENEMAVFDVESTRSNIEDNLMFGNDIGYAGHSSSGAKLITNLFKSNDLAGITFVNSDNNGISMNTIQGSVNGIFLDSQSTDNSVNSNNVLQNHGVDLNNANGLPIETNDNSFSNNNCNTSVPDGLCVM